ncbi:hypothetical protein [Bradyrhizobium ottawaense]|uniref:hypothetical protein n=1 Tax=Bradyrhizobium ottawaense TaxID=931866 RepID=UPI0030F46388
MRNPEVALALIERVKKTRRALDDEIKGVPGANEPLAAIRHALEEIEHIVNELSQ